MLLQLSIHHLALINDMTIDFEPGMNVMTGETGAGKSIVVDAVNLVLGERADRDLITNGEMKARVEAVFDIADNEKVKALLGELTLTGDEDTASISRELNIYAVGLPASLVYNYGAAILRAVGDTKRPLYYLTVSGLCNVVLNVALVAGLRLGVAGVAIATVVSETISAALVLASLITSHGDVRFEPKKTRIERRSLSMILRIGIPAGLQSSMFSISNVLIQSAINSFGAAAIAGNTAAASIEGFATTVSNSISQAALTFSSQNMGAKKYARVRRVLLVCLAATFVGGLTLGLLIYTFGTPLLALFNTDPAVIVSGLVRVRHNMPLYVLFCMQDTFVGQLRGVGYSLLPTITSLSGICLLRVVWLYTAFAASPTLDTLYLSYPVSWAATLFALVVCYAVVVRKMPREL